MKQSGWPLTSSIAAISMAISYILFHLGIYFFFLPIIFFIPFIAFFRSSQHQEQHRDGTIASSYTGSFRLTPLHFYSVLIDERYTNIKSNDYRQIYIGYSAKFMVDMYISINKLADLGVKKPSLYTSTSNPFI
jgi:hypothetical protein